MKKMLVLLLSIGLLAGCGTTPEATEPPPSQTPWIVVITETPGEEEAAQQPSETAPPPSPTARRTVTAAATEASPAAPATAVPTTEEGAATTGEPSATAESSATAAAAAPSRTPSPEPGGQAVDKYPAPVLLEPPNNQPVSWGSTVLLQWIPVGELAEDEYYHVHIERRPMTAAEQGYGDYVFTKDTGFRAERSFLAPFHPPAEYGYRTVYWWVWVVRRTGEDANGKPIGIDISPYSEERTLTIEPKPAGE